ncbi:MAG: hypothetical protein WCD76_09525 [Pyrinomonadaceae bacterium]
MSQTGLSEKFYTVNQITFATFFGGPLGGAILLAKNYQSFNASQSALQAIIGGLLCTFALVPIALILPEQTPKAALPLGYTIALRIIAERLQASEIKARIEAGAVPQSWWLAVGLTLAACIATAIIMTVGMVIALPYFVR